jgi:HEXXH motif-containing protein
VSPSPTTPELASFLVIETPNAPRALQEKQALAKAIIADIREVARAVSPRALPVVDPLCAALAARLEALPAARAGIAVGPELYRWLGAGGAAARCGHLPAIADAIATLPGLLFGRLLASGAEAGPLLVPITDGALRVPIAGIGFPAATGPLVEVALEKHTVLVDGIAFDRDAATAGIDGADPGTPHLGNSGIHFHQRGEIVAEMVAELSATASRPVDHDEALRLIPLAHFEASDVAPIMVNMAAGLELIRTHAPEHAAEVESSIDAVTLVTGRRFVGSSDIFYHGVAVLNPDVEWSPTTYADHLVHEGAHLVLHARNELQPLLRNPDAMGAKSPIREDPRPLYGILHSTFVFLRLVQFFRLAADAIGSDESMFRLHRHLLGFYEGMTELERFASFTPEGAALFKGMRAAQRDFRTSLPEPDPQYYKRVGKDYVV